MNGMTALLEQFSLPELTRVLRRTALSALGVAVVAFIVCLFLSHTIFGFGLCIGLGLGLANIRLVTAQTAKVSQSKMTKPVRALASLTLARLAATTIVVIGLAVFVTSLGLGAVGGIAIFYFVFLINLIGSILRHRGATT